MSTGDLCDERAGHGFHFVHEDLCGVIVAGDAGKFLFPDACEFRRLEDGRGKHRDERRAFVGGDERLAVARDVVALEKRLDHCGTGRGSAESGVLHREPEFFVFDLLTRRFHRAEQGSL